MTQRIFFILIIFCAAAMDLARADEGPFKVAIELGKVTNATLPSEAPLTIVNVHTTITNTSDTEQTLHVMSCDYAHSWQADSKLISVGFEVCARNVPSSVKIKAGKDYKRDLQLTLLPGTSLGKLMFRLGFVPGLDLATTALSGEPVWSEPVILKVDKEMLKGVLPERAASNTVMAIRGAGFDDLSAESKAFLANHGMITVPGEEVKK